MSSDYHEVFLKSKMLALLFYLATVRPKNMNIRSSVLFLSLVSCGLAFFSAHVLFILLH